MNATMENLKNQAPSRQMAAERSVRNMQLKKLMVKPKHTPKSPALSDVQQTIRIDCCKKLCQRYDAGNLPNIIFTGEKKYSVGSSYKRSEEALMPLAMRIENGVVKSQPDIGLMIWAGFTANGRTPLVFMPYNAEKELKTQYCEIALQGCLKPWVKQHVNNEKYTSQHNSTAMYNSKKIQTWLWKNTPNETYISPKEWPKILSDLSPMDSTVWKVLEESVCKKNYGKLDDVKAAFKQAWESIPEEVLRAAANKFFANLKTIANEAHSRNDTEQSCDHSYGVLKLYEHKTKYGSFPINCYETPVKRVKMAENTSTNA